MNSAIPTAQLYAYVNGRPFGLIASFNWTSETQRRPIRGVDQMEPYELAPATNRVHGTMSLYRLQGSAGVEGAGMVAQFSDVMKEKYFTLLIQDRVTKEPIFRADYCSVVSQSWSASAKGLVQGQVSFEALDWSNEFR